MLESAGIDDDHGRGDGRNSKELSLVAKPVGKDDDPEVGDHATDCDDSSLGYH